MAKRDILKEAIADAKTVKETAIANAKAALEEAFTPRLKEMLATKLEEMDLDEEEEIKKEDMRHKDDKGPDRGAERKSLDSEPRYNKKKDLDEEKEDMDEEINLDEILAEIEEMDNKDEIKEDEASDKEEEGYIDGEEDADEDKDEEELDLEDMSDDDLKNFIEDVIADMVASGDLEAGENFEEEDETEEVDVEDEVDVEISEEKEKIDKVEEVSGMPTSNVARSGNKFDAMSNEELAKYFADKLKSGAKGVKDKIMSVFTEELDEVSGMPTSNVARSGNKFDAMSNAELAKYFADKLKAGGEKLKDKLTSMISEINEEEKEAMEEELAEAYSTIKSLKSDLQEINLLNGKLLYTNKIFKAKNLTESQKVKVLGAFDKAGTIKETKLVFETLSEGLKEKKRPMIKESLGAASRVSTNTNTKKPIIETNPMVARFQKLAGLK